MAELVLRRVNALPQNLQPNALYFVKRGDGAMDIVVGDNDGEGVRHCVLPLQMIIESTPGLLPAAAIFGRYLAPDPLELVEASCLVRADVAATNIAVMPVHIGNVLVARATFAAGSAQAAVEILQPIIPAGSLVLFGTPVVQDPTLSGVTGTYSARRT